MTTQAVLENDRANIADLGITYNHAFTISRVEEIEELGVRLVCVRNPWGAVSINDSPSVTGEFWEPRWKGNYSRFSEKWNPQLIEILKPELHRNDGKFWMDFNDFKRYFRSASLCHLRNGEEYAECRISTRIEYRYDAINNREDIEYPQIILDISEMESDCSLEWIGVSQEDLRSQYTTHSEYMDVCVFVARLLSPEKSLDIMEPLFMTDARKSRGEFHNKFAKLSRKPGKYLIIPYSPGLVFHKDFKDLKSFQSRKLNLSLFFRRSSKPLFGRPPRPPQIYQSPRKPTIKTFGIKQVLSQFLRALVKPKSQREMWEFHERLGNIWLFGLRNMRGSSRLVGTTPINLTNVLPAVGFDQKYG